MMSKGKSITDRMMESLIPSDTLRIDEDGDPELWPDTPGEYHVVSAEEWDNALRGFIGVDGDGYVCLLPEEVSRWPELMEALDDPGVYRLVRVKGDA